MYDLVIRGATIVDGLGHDPLRAEIAVKDGRISRIGEIPADAAEVIDAGGLALMPGIIGPEEISTTPRPGPPIAPTSASNSDKSLIVDGIGPPPQPEWFSE